MNHLLTILLLQVAIVSKTLVSVNAFSSPSPTTSKNFLSAFTDLFDNKSKSNTNNVAAANAERENLKSDLISVCNDESVKEEEKRKNVEDLISKLREISPIEKTATSPLLQKEWLLLWTTEKEINLFIDWNLSKQITQTIDDGVLLNNIPFQKGGSFGVKGKLSIPDGDENDGDDTSASKGIRTEFEFETATLDLAKWGTYSFPPVGKGWFDTVYLDDSFRIDVNSRDDILICQSD